MVRNCLILLLYLVVHLTIQGLYQADRMCAPKYWHSNTADPTTNANNLKQWARPL